MLIGMVVFFLLILLSLVAANSAGQHTFYPQQK